MDLFIYVSTYLCMYASMYVWMLHIRTSDVNAYAFVCVCAFMCAYLSMYTCME